MVKTALGRLTNHGDAVTADAILNHLHVLWPKDGTSVSDLSHLGDEQYVRSVCVALLEQGLVDETPKLTAFGARYVEDCHRLMTIEEAFDRMRIALTP